MNNGTSPTQQQVTPSLQPSEGWHCTHSFYRFDRIQLAAFGAEERQGGAERICAASGSRPPGGPGPPADEHRQRT